MVAVECVNCATIWERGSRRQRRAVASWALGLQVEMYRALHAEGTSLPRHCRRMEFLQAVLPWVARRCVFWRAGVRAGWLARVFCRKLFTEKCMGWLGWRNRLSR